MLFLLKNYLVFNWRIIALQNFVVFCQISTWISHRYTYVPSLLHLPPISLPIPPLLVVTEPLFEFPEPYSKFSLAVYFTRGIVSFHVTVSIHLTLSSTHHPLPTARPCVHESVLCVYFSIADRQTLYCWATREAPVSLFIRALISSWGSYLQDLKT